MTYIEGSQAASRRPARQTRDQEPPPLLPCTPERGDEASGTLESG